MRDRFTVSPAAARFHNAEDIQAGNLGDKYDITFFVSCYNEEEFIVATLDTVKTAMVGLGLSYDIVIIDDGSKDRSPELVRNYIAAHPEIDIVFRQNARNKGWAQNYIDSTFLGKGRYHRAICGDNSEMVSTIHAVLKPLGEADIIIPYYVDVEGKPAFRQVVSTLYTTIVNLLSGNSLHYYNGLPIHRRYNVMRWHPDTRGFGFQAYILCLLLGQGATYKEVALSAQERRAGSSNALTWRNLLSVSHTLSEIWLRRLSNRVHGRIAGGLAALPEQSQSDVAAREMASNPDRVG
jgi:glycosyltransferase involved in cell wall biosynthesis